MPKLAPIHPGEILNEEFLSPFGVTQYRLAVDLGVPPRRINEIVLGRRAISADTALRLAHYFGNSAEFWMSLQSRYDLLLEQDRIGASLANVPRLDPSRQTAAQPQSKTPMRKRVDRVIETFRKGTPINDAVRTAILEARPPGNQPPPTKARRGPAAKARKPGR